MYEIITTGCPEGYGFVRDYQGNKIYYGTLEECRECIGILVKPDGILFGLKQSRKDCDRNA